MGGGRSCWEPWYTLRPDGKVSCKFCETLLCYRKDRLLFHLGYRRNDNLLGVRVCNKASGAVKLMFFNCGGHIPAVVADGNVGDVEVTSPSTTRPSGVGGGRHPDASVSTNDGGENTGGQSSQVRSSEAPNPSLTHSRPMRQVSVQEGMDTSNKQVLDKKWARFFYEANIPFNVVRHPAFLDVVKATSESRVAYKPPTYHALRTKLIKSTKDEVAAMVREKTKAPIHKYGVTICSDGWDNVTHRPLMNVMLACTSGEVFLGSIDTTGECKDATYVANCMGDYIDEVGAQNVVQVCTDNAANMLAAGALLLRRFPHIYFQGCSAHALDLLLEDWGKQDWITSMVKKAKSIVKYIRMHHMPLAIFRRHSPNHVLKNPVQTRFATTFLMIERLVEVREAVESTVHDAQWNEYTRKLTSTQKQEKANSVRRSVRNDEFWRRCLNFVHIVEPVLIALREFDGKHPCMDKAWLVMKKVEKHVLSLRDPPFSLEQRYAIPAIDDFYKRWDMLRTDLHYAGALLNPFLLDEVMLMDDDEAREAILRVLRKLAVGDQAFASALSEYQAFRDRRGIFGGLPDVNTLNLEPHEWWDLLGAGARTLAPIARKILAQVCSASSCERNWSMYSFVHNKSRNRLTSERAEELVYIYTNSKTLRERAAANPTRWYTENMMSEDSMTDESDGLDRGSVQSDLDDDDSDDNYNDGDDAPFAGFGGFRGGRPLIDESVFDFEEGDNNNNDHEGHERSPPRMPQAWNGGSSGEKTNENVVAPRPLSPDPMDVQVRGTLDRDGTDGEGGREEDVVVEESLPTRSPRGEGPPHGGERDILPSNRGGQAVQRQMPLLDNPRIQSSSRPSISKVRHGEPSSSIGTRLASIVRTLNVSERTTPNQTALRPPSRSNNQSKRPRQEGTTSERVSTRTRRRLRREEVGTQPFSREVNLGGPNTNGVMDTTGQRPLRTLSSIVRPRRNRNSNAASESDSATSGDDGDSIGGTVGEDGEVPGDSDYRVPRQGPLTGVGGNQPTPEEANANTLVRNLRHGRR